jgi:hypothetical protein
MRSAHCLLSPGASAQSGSTGEARHRRHAREMPRWRSACRWACLGALPRRGLTGGAFAGRGGASCWPAGGCHGRGPPPAAHPAEGPGAGAGGKNGRLDTRRTEPRDRGLAPCLGLFSGLENGISRGKYSEKLRFSVILGGIYLALSAAAGNTVLRLDRVRFVALSCGASPIPTVVSA